MELYRPATANDNGSTASVYLWMRVCVCVCVYSLKDKLYLHKATLTIKTGRVEFPPAPTV